MPFVLKLLKAAQSNNGLATTLYTVPAATSAIVSNIRFVNTSGGSATVDLFFKPGGGTGVRILDKAMRRSSLRSMWLPESGVSRQKRTSVAPNGYAYHGVCRRKRA